MDRHGELLSIVRANGLQHFDEPLQLASGEWSHDFVDGKAALSRGADLRLACDLMIESAATHGIQFDAVGGLTLGADAFSHGVALRADCEWFVIRKQPKGRGTNKSVEGARLTADSRVFLVDDVVTTGGSIRQAYEEVRATGAQVVIAATLVDRGERANTFFQEVGVPYRPLLTYADLEIPPVGNAQISA